MFKVTKSIEYAVLLLVSLDVRLNKPLSLTSIAQDKNLPLKYLEKIVLKLKDNDILASSQGVKGGYFLSRPASDISLGEIIQAVGGKKGLVTCVYGSCDLAEHCFHKKVWLKLQQILDNELYKIKLADLLG